MLEVLHIPKRKGVSRSSTRNVIASWSIPKARGQIIRRKTRKYSQQWKPAFSIRLKGVLSVLKLLAVVLGRRLWDLSVVSTKFILMRLIKTCSLKIAFTENVNCDLCHITKYFKKRFKSISFISLSLKVFNLNINVFLNLFFVFQKYRLEHQPFPWWNRRPVV